MLQNIKFSDEDWECFRLFDRRAVSDINNFNTNKVCQKMEFVIYQKKWTIAFPIYRFTIICFRVGFSFGFFVFGISKVSTSESELWVRLDLLICCFFCCTTRGAKSFNFWGLLIPIDFAWLFGFLTNTRTSKLQVVVINSSSEHSICIFRSILGKFFSKKIGSWLSKCVTPASNVRQN